MEFINLPYGKLYDNFEVYVYDNKSKVFSVERTPSIVQLNTSISINN